MPSISTGLTWDEATEPVALELARSFESAWKAATPGRWPDPADFLRRLEPARPGPMLAVLRVDLALRRSAGEDARPERYRDRFPELPSDAFVALLYEEYCLREEAGDRPGPGEYEARFPEVAARLREILQIHDLVAEPGSTSRDDDPHLFPFPEAGETIAGFRLVEELGRGSFARVFLAQERQLADRLVALKVSRTGSREPQTLARLQHTHIVPVHSYRTDPATGLHLLCMPYFGRVTLARLLADSAAKRTTTGNGLLDVLDRLDPAGLSAHPPGENGSREGMRSQALRTDRSNGSSARAALGRLSTARAVAWWGARMAEALQHAHDRGVLHRDVKPSNVLITSDGLPMLLDFNLAREEGGDGDGPSRLGGTLAYMAPEHLEALVRGHDGEIDHRADLYSMGMVLAEALGSKPMELTSEAPTLAESLTRLIEHRRRESPRLSVGAFPIPPAMTVVVHRCLSHDPADRYQSASDLAIDLQAVANDAPLGFAREPWSPRARRWVRNHRSRLAIVTPMVVAVVALLVALFRAQAESIRREDNARQSIRDGVRSGNLGEFQAAEAQFATAAAMIHDQPGLDDLRREALRLHEAAETSKTVRDRADLFFDRAEPLRFALLGFVGDRADASRSMMEVLDPLGVLNQVDWIDRAGLRHLDLARRSRLFREVDDLLFIWVVAALKDEPDRARVKPVALRYCEKALRFTDDARPWVELRVYCQDASPVRPSLPVDLSLERSAGACFRWYLLGKLRDDPGSAVQWLERATRLEPSSYWPQYALAFEHTEAGHLDRALPACEAAIALRPGSPWAWKCRARIMVGLARWREALDDLDRALATCSRSTDEARIRLDRGVICQRLGDFDGARLDDEAVIRADPDGPTGRDARRNLARIDADCGSTAAALARYDSLIESGEDDTRSRQGRLRLRMRIGRADLAEADLEVLLSKTPRSLRGPLLADRATARLVQNRPAEAEADALEAFRLEPTASHARLLDRARLASGKPVDRWPDRPNAFDGWPDGGDALRVDLRAAAGRLDPADRRTRAVLLSATLDHPAALDLADRLVAESPASPLARSLRARIKLRAGRASGALADVEAALHESPEDPELVGLRGIIRVELGEFESGLDDLNVAGARRPIRSWLPSMARALMATGRPSQAADIWSRALIDDPLDARAYLGLAEARRRMGEWDRAFVALEEAASVVEDRSTLLPRIALAYAACLPSRPERWTRMIGLGRRMAAPVR